MGAWELVSEVDISSPVSQVDFTGISFNSDDELLLVSEQKNTTASNTNTRIYVNGDTTAANYSTQRIENNGSSITGSRFDNTIINTDSSTFDFCKSNVYFKLSNAGYFEYKSFLSRAIGTTLPSMYNAYGAYRSTISSITQITLKADVANTIEAGSNFKLFKRIGEVVADTTVTGSAVTSVDFTGLSIDKDSEYMIIADINNTSGSASDYYLYANGNTTATNYYSQYVAGNGTAVTAGITNNARFSYTDASSSVMNLTRLRQNIRDYFAFETNNTRKYATTTLLINDFHGGSTFTVTSITQLTITASITNAIGIGSRIKIIKLY